MTENHVLWVYTGHVRTRLWLENTNTHFQVPMDKTPEWCEHTQLRTHTGWLEKFRPQRWSMGACRPCHTSFLCTQSRNWETHCCFWKIKNCWGWQRGRQWWGRQSVWRDPTIHQSNEHQAHRERLWQESFAPYVKRWQRKICMI
jgi:hypothetical protein